MRERVDLADKLSRFSELWSPRIVGHLNDYKIQVVKVKGEFVWHTHADKANTSPLGGSACGGA